MGICALGETPEVVFAWALNASGLNLPPDVGFQIGSSVGISYLVIQIHYGYPEGEGDMSVLSLNFAPQLALVVIVQNFCK